MSIDLEAISFICLSPESHIGPSRCRYAIHPAVMSDQKNEGAMILRDAAILETSCMFVFSREGHGELRTFHFMSCHNNPTGGSRWQWTNSTFREPEVRGWQSLQPVGVLLCNINNTLTIKKSLGLTLCILIVFFTYNPTYSQYFPRSNYYPHLAARKVRCRFQSRESLSWYRTWRFSGSSNSQSPGCFPCLAASRKGKQLNR